MKMPTIQPRSRLAHEAAKWAGTKGCSAEFHLTLFQALFQYNLDIGSIQVLLNLAGSLGLAPGPLQKSLAQGEFTTMVVGDENEAMNSGVRAVPAFVVDGRLLAAGVQDVDRLQELISGAAGGVLPLI